jgi:hypothetical protein
MNDTFFQMISFSAVVVLIVTTLVQKSSSQLIRPISIPGIFSMIRFQNTACNGESDEGGTCLYEVFIPVPAFRPL